MNFRRSAIIIFLLSCFTFISVAESHAQNFSESKEHKKLWKRFKRKKKRDAYNPNISKSTNKTKGLESKKLAKENKKVLKAQKRMIRREKRKLRRKKGAYKKAK